MKFLVGSLQYSPVFKSHCCAMGRQLELAGHEVRYLFGSSYDWMLNQDTRNKCVFIGKSDGALSALADGVSVSARRRIRDEIDCSRPDFVYMPNIHPILNRCVSIESRKKGSKFIQHVHEPYVIDKSAYEISHRLMLYAFEMAQSRLLQSTDIAVVSSDEAKNLFEKKYPEFDGELVFIPLLYEDFGARAVPMEKRRYSTFVGPLSSAKGRDIFLQLVDYMQRQRKDTEFLLISRGRGGDKTTRQFRNLKIHSEERISDDEIGSLFHQSVVTLAPYKTARQSSVVATSFMYGVPVLASDISGLREVINHKTTGYLVNPNASIEEWIEGLDYISGNFEQMSSRCRKAFLDSNSERNWPAHFIRLFGGESSDDS